MASSRPLTRPTQQQHDPRMNTMTTRISDMTCIYWLVFQALSKRRSVISHVYFSFVKSCSRIFIWDFLSGIYVIIYCSNLWVYMEYGRLLREQSATRNAWAYYTNDHIAYQARATRYDTNVHTIIYLSATLHLPKPKHTCDSPFHIINLTILLFQAGYLALLLSTGIPGIRTAAFEVRTPPHQHSPAHLRLSQWLASPRAGVALGPRL